MTAPEVRRSRRLVKSSFSTAGPTNYGFFWYFFKDGSIRLEVRLTGIMVMGALKAGNLRDTYAGRPSAVCPVPSTISASVTTSKSTVWPTRSTGSERKPEPPGPENLHGNARRAVPKLLRRGPRRRLTDASNARRWKVVNPDVLNDRGNPIGYRLGATSG